MATGYQDWNRLTYLQEQSASLYYADIFRLLDQSPVVTGIRTVVTGAEWLVWGSVTVQDTGRIILFGTITVMGD